MSCLYVKLDTFEGTSYVRRDLVLEIDVIRDEKDRIVSVEMYKYCIRPGSEEGLYHMSSVEGLVFSDKPSAHGTLQAGLAVLKQLGVGS